MTFDWLIAWLIMTLFAWFSLSDFFVYTFCVFFVVLLCLRMSLARRVIQRRCICEWGCQTKRRQQVALRPKQCGNNLSFTDSPLNHAWHLKLWAKEQKCHAYTLTKKPPGVGWGRAVIDQHYVKICKFCRNFLGVTFAFAELRQTYNWHNNLSSH